MVCTNWGPEKLPSGKISVSVAPADFSGGAGGGASERGGGVQQHLHHGGSGRGTASRVLTQHERHNTRHVGACHAGPLQVLISRAILRWRERGAAGSVFSITTKVAMQSQVFATWSSHLRHGCSELLHHMSPLLRHFARHAEMQVGIGATSCHRKSVEDKDAAGDACHSRTATIQPCCAMWRIINRTVSPKPTSETALLR